MTPQKQTEIILDLLKQMNNKLPKNSVTACTDIYSAVENETRAADHEEPTIDKIEQQ